MEAELIFAILLFMWAAQDSGQSDPVVLESYRSYALTHVGDVAAGKKLFEADAKLVCTDCHRITGQEKSGPNLDGIGEKHTRADLIRHILMPSETIRPGYEQAVILMRSGRVLTGRLERSTRLGVRLLDTKGQTVNLDRDQIEEIHQSRNSLMPDNVHTLLTKQQFADLIAYLESLRYGVKSGLAAGGRTVDIPRLERPIALTPIHPPEVVFENPVWCGAIPGIANQLAVVEHQRARVWRYIRDPQQPRKELFLDLSAEVYISGNQGLMCLAFHPDFERNGRYFLEHEVQEGGKVKTIIVERRASDDRLRDSGRPSIRLLEVEQPAFNHNGGCIAFGNDGMLYAAFGDGGPQKDPEGHSQNPRVLLGSFVRVDVDRAEDGRSYAIPMDNPFLAAHQDDPMVRPETWAIGFREPWRFSFDRLTGDLWVGDVGQNKFEEVCLVRRGENHGWNIREAFAPFSDQYRRQGETYTDPLFAYPHGVGFSVTGGHVYRGDPGSPFYGVYIFGDYNSRKIWGLRQEDGQVLDVRELATAPGGIASFGVDHRGELLLVTYAGQILQLGLE